MAAVTDDTRLSPGVLATSLETPESYTTPWIYVSLEPSISTAIDFAYNDSSDVVFRTYKRFLNERERTLWSPGDQ